MMRNHFLFAAAAALIGGTALANDPKATPSPWVTTSPIEPSVDMQYETADGHMQTTLHEYQFTVREGLLKEAVQGMISRYQPQKRLVWLPNKRLMVPSVMVVKQRTFEDLVGGVIGHYGLAACEFGNNIIAVWEYRTDHYFCRD